MPAKASGFIHPLSAFRLTGSTQSSITLRSAKECLEISVITEDLFRLRIARGRSFSTVPSWSVLDRPWPEINIHRRTRRSTVSLSTRAGTFKLHLADGSWVVTDHTSQAIFVSNPQASGFGGMRPRLALKLEKDDLIFGLGESTGTFNKRGLQREFWNIDVLGLASAIHPGLGSMYLSIPFGICLRTPRAGAIFWDNPRRQKWDMGQTKLDEWTLEAAGGEMDFYLFTGPDLPAILKRYTELTGRMPLPPRWALGYHQSRYSYETRERLEEIAAAFRRKKIPCDALYLDIHHMDGYRVFTFGKRFPNPGEMLRRLARRGFKVVAIIDPGVKNDSRFGVLRRGLAQKAFVKKPGGRRDYIGKAWPGPSRFPDFTRQQVRDWWAGEQAQFQASGLAGFWNDMNEPANFALPSKTLPENSIHLSDYGPVKHHALHNIYGMQMARASRQGALLCQPGQRPFIISRAGYAGLQRYAMVWTGDNSSNWEHLAESIGMLLNLSLSGLAFCGADVGGFLDSATGELLARWTQLAAFTPFFRNHANNESRAQEPWVFGKEIESICRKYIEMRYELLPYLYSLFQESHRGGVPIIRPLFWPDARDPIANRIDDQFFLGDNLLVAPILRQGARARQVYLPAGTWYDFWTARTHAGRQHILALADLAMIPIFVRAGAVIPFGPIQQFVGSDKAIQINLRIWDGENGRLDWYEDDGESLEYERGVFHQRTISFAVGQDQRALRFGPSEGLYPTRVNRWQVSVLGGSAPKELFFNGGELKWRRSHSGFLFQISNLMGEMEVVWTCPSRVPLSPGPL